MILWYARVAVYKLSCNWVAPGGGGTSGSGGRGIFAAASSKICAGVYTDGGIGTGTMRMSRIPGSSVASWIFRKAIVSQ